MIVAGKCPPESSELEVVKQKGFEKVELYLEKHHLDDIDETVENIEKSELDAVSVHTPHVHIRDEKEYFVLADELAQRLDAFLVIHSQYVQHVHIPELENLEIESDCGYENNPGSSLRHIEESILEKDRPMVLDVAHFFMAEEDYLSKLKYLLNNYSDNIKLIHLCDSSLTEDGLAFGEGDMDMNQTIQIVSESEFDQILVLEVMPEHQEDALEKYRSYASEIV